MDAQDFRSLQEAYMEIVENQQLDEISVELARKAVKGRQKRTDDLMDLDTLGQTNKPSAETEISHNKLDDNKRRLRNKIRAQKSSPTPRAKLNVEQVDLYDIILSHLLDEGYAETSEAAEAIMVNMSEEWRENIIDEAYVDYRKGRLSSGRTPQTALKSGVERAKVNASREQRAGGSFGTTATPSWKRSKKADSVGREMDAHTGVGGKINKALSPGLGNRPGAGPRVAYGEPNTDRHQGARYRRGQPSTKD
jgi:hypothetical protein